DRNQNIFPKNIVYLIRIGEATGRLAEMLKKGAEHLQKIQAIINDTRQALMYPCFVLLAIMAGVVFWFYSVVPNIIQVFTEMDIALPPLTIAVMRVSAFVRSNILYLILLPSLLVAGTAILRRTSKRVLRLTDGLLLKLPVIGSIAVASNMAYITEYFSLLINSGITVLESLNILRDAVGNQFYSARLNHIGQRLIKGRKIAEAFDDAGIFPTYVTQMVSIGEASGSLPEQLKLISEEYSRKLNDTIALIGKMIEPIVLGLAGAMFAVIIGGLLLPIYDLLGGIAG
ncbi:MAG: type II secretion system F family protein, partial [Deltaproteobacteria bacterium]|nr:type II secretion system F family protein [Deltaproteobacteria bacterium]